MVHGTPVTYPTLQGGRGRNTAELSLSVSLSVRKEKQRGQKFDCFTPMLPKSTVTCHALQGMVF
jgi:hypothetical protein